jgi:hypothetical protein
LFASSSSTVGMAWLVEPAPAGEIAAAQPAEIAEDPLSERPKGDEARAEIPPAVAARETGTLVG